MFNTWERGKQVFPVPDELRPIFFEAANSYLKGLKLNDLHPDYSGIRPKTSKTG